MNSMSATQYLVFEALFSLSLSHIYENIPDLLTMSITFLFLLLQIQ